MRRAAERLRLLGAALLLLCWLPAAAQNAAVASAHPLATAAGEAVLAGGGNAFDAAVAVAATLAVVEPWGSGLGGGGFFLLHRAADGRQVMVDARETAPAAARAELYQDAAGALTRARLVGPLAAGIPGTPAALDHLARRYGRLPLARTLLPAMRLAREGFPVGPRYAELARLREADLRSWPASGVFLDRGRAPDVGWVLRQPELADTLGRLARAGADGFYRGPVAQRLVAAVRAAGGVWQEADLAGYRVLEREPERFRYRGAAVTTASLPSAGGLALRQALGILERFDLDGVRGPQRLHLVAEAMRRAYEDRARHLGDPDFVAVPLARLRSADYFAGRAAGIDLAAAGSSGTAPAPAAAEGTHTTHFSIADGEGNRVAATLSVNTLFGSGFVAAGTGVLLNNEMDDFALLAGVPNAYGLRGSAANALAPGKRPLSSMSPTFVEDERGILILGTPGGSRIISMVLLGVLEYVHGRPRSPEQIVSLPRFHHQWLPDRIEVEPAVFPQDWLDELTLRGHLVQVAERPWGNMQAVLVDKASGRATAAGDPRVTP